MMRRLVFTLVVALTCVSETGHAAPENVVWTSLVNAAATGNTLTKNAGTATGGAVSTQSIGSGDGYVEFTVVEPETNRAAGLSNGNSGVWLEDIDFAVRLNGAGSAEILEGGVYKWETTYVGGDVFRVEVVAGAVVYRKNGAVFYQSDGTPVYPLLVDAFMDSPNATIHDAIISSAEGGGSLPPEGILFESTWDTAAGTSIAAVTDGGRWPKYDEYNNGTGVQLLSVVPGGVSGHNALRVQQRGSTFAANLQVDDFVPPSQGYYVRFYMRNDDTSEHRDHMVTVDTFHYWNLTFMSKFNEAPGWHASISTYGCGEHYPYNHWAPPGLLARGQWYRFEYFVDFLDATHVRVHPRVYALDGTLLYSAADFRQQDYNPDDPANNATLATYYAAGNSFCVDPSWMNDFGLGNNGQFSSTDTGLYWYFSAVQIRSDTWPGP